VVPATLALQLSQDHHGLHLGHGPRAAGGDDQAKRVAELPVQRGIPAWQQKPGEVRTRVVRATQAHGQDGQVQFGRAERPGVPAAGRMVAVVVVAEDRGAQILIMIMMI
jgi:hypothetical protein